MVQIWPLENRNGKNLTVIHSMFYIILDAINWTFWGKSWSSNHFAKAASPQLLVEKYTWLVAFVTMRNIQYLSYTVGDVLVIVDKKAKLIVIVHDGRMFDY